ncbi:hypothetical protein E2542_SST00720 [Spatholobus suberectus]|nr:hypothetical protein E2542_SST00720 [Spatholobus suberectus]
MRIGREWGAWAWAWATHDLRMIENDNLLERGVGGEGLGGEVGGDPTAEIFVVLAHHVDEVVFAEEFFAEGVAHESEGVGPDIGEDFVGEFGVSDEYDEVADDVVGGEA